MEVLLFGKFHTERALRMESIRSDLKNSNVVGSVSGNTKTDGSRHVLVQCLRVLTVRVRVQVRVHCFQVQVQVLKICTRILLEYKYTYQVLQLCNSDTLQHLIVCALRR